MDDNKELLEISEKNNIQGNKIRDLMISGGSYEDIKKEFQLLQKYHYEYQKLRYGKIKIRLSLSKILRSIINIPFINPKSRGDK